MTLTEAVANNPGKRLRRHGWTNLANYVFFYSDMLYRETNNHAVLTKNDILSDDWYVVEEVQDMYAPKIGDKFLYRGTPYLRLSSTQAVKLTDIAELSTFSKDHRPLIV